MERELLSEIKELVIDVVNADTSIFYNDKYEKPLLIYNGKFDIKENFGKVEIIQHRSERHHKIVNIVGSIVISDEVYTNEDDEDDESFIRVILPTLDKFDCNIKAVSSDISIEDVAIENLDVEVVSGDIEVNDAILGNSHVKTTAGDIDLIVDDSEYSYNIDVNVVSGSVDISSIDMSASKEIKELKIETVTGDISVSGS